MGHSINGPGIHIDICDVNFNCPACGHLHSEEDWFEKFMKSKKALIYIKCKGCKVVIGVTVDMRGDVVCWLKKDESGI